MPLLEVGSDNGTPVTLHYTDQGTGRPVVLIHGWPLSGRAWERQVTALVEGGHRVVTYDRRGFGQSSQPSGGYDYDTFTADLAALLEQLDLREVTLVGFSMGGGEVARYIGTHGTGRVARAVFAGAVPPYLAATADNPDGAIDDATVQSLVDGVRGDRYAFLEGFLTTFFDAAGTETVSEQLRHAMWIIGAGASPKGTEDCIRAFCHTDFRTDLTKVDVPTLVIHGDSDAIVPFEASGRRTAESVPGAELVVIQGGPHGITASHPEEFNRALLDFLRS